MRCTIVLEFDNGDGSVGKRVEVMRFHRPVEDQTPGDVGLSLAEGKSLLNCVQQEFVVEQIERFCASRRSCVDCGVQRRLHDSHCSELKTALGKVFYCRERWKACNCGADGSRHVSPLKNYLTEASTGELRWLHAELGATMPRVWQRHCLIDNLRLVRSPLQRGLFRFHTRCARSLKYHRKPTD
jgi:hypothetical protein